MNDNSASTPFWTENSNAATKELIEKDLNKTWRKTLTSKEKKDLLSYYLGSKDEGEFGKDDRLIRYRVAYKKDDNEIKAHIGIAIFDKKLEETMKNELTAKKIQSALPYIEEVQKILNWYAGAPYGELITPCFILECPLDKALKYIPNDFMTQVRQRDIIITPTCVTNDCCENSFCNIV